MENKRKFLALKAWLTRSRAGAPQWIWLTLVLLSIGLLYFLISADKPWQGEAMTKLAEGRNLKVPEAIQAGLWLAAALNLLLLAVLAAMLPLLARWSRMPEGATPILANFRKPVWTWVNLGGLALVMIFALGLRLPTLNDSIHRDEQDTLRRNTFGYYEQRDDGTLKFKKRHWKDVLWENGAANNPVFYSICQRLCLQVSWKLGLPRDRFHILAVRLPSLIGGMAAIFLLWYLLMAMELPSVAWGAALLSAMHPMHVDFSAEGRGYSFVLFFTLLTVFALALALRQGKWRWWALYGLAQFLLLYSNPGSLYFPLVLNLVLLGYLGWRWARGAGPRREAPDIAADRSLARGHFVRLLVANAISAMVYLQLMAPCIPQMLNNFKITSVRGPMGIYWQFQVLAEYTAGLLVPLPAEGADAEYLQIYLREHFSIAQPVVMNWMFGVVPIITLLGMFCLWNKGLLGRIIVLLTVFPPVLCYLHHAQITGLYLYYWYVIFMLPFLLTTWAAGLTLPFSWLADRIERLRNRDSPVPAPAGVGLRFLRNQAWIAALLIAMPLYFMVSQEGRGHLRSGEGIPYVQILRGKYTWRVYPEGRMVRYDKDRVPDELMTESFAAPMDQ